MDIIAHKIYHLLQHKVLNTDRQFVSYMVPVS